jgi:hypothetical protein
MSQAKSYAFQGRHPVAEGTSFLDALYDMLDQWLAERSLSMHAPGKMLVTLGIGSVQVEIEIVDRKVLGDFIYNPEGLIDYIASRMGVPVEEAKELIGQVDQARLEATELMDPSGSHVPMADPDRMVEAVAPVFVHEAYRALIQKEEIEARRAPGRARSKASKDLIWRAIQAARAMKISDQQLSEKIEVSTRIIRSIRKERTPSGPDVVESVKVPSKRQMERVLRAVERADGNLTEAARRLHVPRSTLRDLYQRFEHREEIRSTVGRTRTELRHELLARVASGEKASTVAREMGVAERTARGWAAEAKKAGGK